jgi:inorganic triphosphatase YgiF
MNGAGPGFSDSQLRELIELTRGADSVELKLTVPDEDTGSTVDALALDPLEARLRQVFFLETPDLDLNRSGVVVRARRTQGRDDD